MAKSVKLTTTSGTGLIAANEQKGELISQEVRSVAIDLRCNLPHGELVRLYRSIEAALPDISNRVIHFVSAYEGEGANTIAFETAVVVAKLVGKRVLFIDTAAPARETPAPARSNIGIPLETLLLTGHLPHEAVARAEGLDFYFARLRERGEDGFRPASLVAVEKAIEHLRMNFDLIVIDSQGILKDAFGIALAKLVDGSILVVEAESTRAPVALESKRMVEAGGGRIIGAILNKRRFYIPDFLYRMLYARSAS